MFKGVEHHLGFSKLIEETAKLASSNPGKEAVLKIKSFTNRESVINAVETTAQMINLMKEITVKLESFNDISPIIKKLNIQGSILSPQEILEVKKVCTESTKLLKIRESAAKRYKHIVKLTSKLHNFSEIVKEISAKIDETGLVTDEASAKLKMIRNSIKAVRSSIKEKLEEFIRKNESLISEKIITIRHDRYVIPVKPAFFKKFTGIAHDRSSSGSSIYVEPSFTVSMNNALTKLKNEEEKEIKNILRELTQKLSEFKKEIKNAFECLTEIDRQIAVSTMSMRLKGIVPKISNTIKIKGARNPILEITGRKTIPVDIMVEKGLVITGSNTGGKTVALKTLGIFTLMLQSGFLIPAEEGSSTKIFKHIMADIGDEQSIEQNLSTFSYHIKNISEMLGKAGSDSLILIDEPGAGTDPAEGSALAIGILRFLKKKKATVVATTHFLPVKLFAMKDDYYTVATVMFDEKELKPLFKINYNTIGKSHAFEVAKRYGIPEEVIAKATSAVPPEEREASELLKALEEEYRKLQRRERELEKEIEALRREKQKIKEEGIKQIEMFISSLQTATQKKQRRKGKTDRIVTEARRRILQLKNARFKEGQTVKLTGGRTGKIISIDNQKNTAKVLLGQLTITVDLTKLEPYEKEQKQETVKINVEKPSRFYPELSIRGMKADEAMLEVERFLDSAVRTQSFRTVKIIHGHGYGILKRLVRNYLRGSPYVESFRKGNPEEGGDGVTVVTLKI